ncbi:MAG: DUF721 domain-containing protein [Planctomycetaceae bacterium]|nr:DUF721 domain-containing protein [Planctomycetaceae bacterium]
MTDFSLGKPARLGQLLQNLVRQKGLSESSATEELNSVWKKAAGERVGDRSYVRGVRAGVLEIAVSNSAILEELNGFLQHELLPQVQQQCPIHQIRSLRFIRAF